MKILKEQSEVTTKPTTLSNGWGVNVKVPSGFTKVDSWSDYSNIEEGAIVYINPNYAQDSKDARKFFVMELSRGYALLADNKTELRNGEGRIYNCIEYYKNPIYESKQGNKNMKTLKEDFTIEDMYASAWQNAIDNVGNVLNKELGLNLQVLDDDWRQVERIADALKIRFDVNGEII